MKRKIIYVPTVREDEIEDIVLSLKERGFTFSARVVALLVSDHKRYKREKNK